MADFGQLEVQISRRWGKISKIRLRVVKNPIGTPDSASQIPLAITHLEQKKSVHLTIHDSVLQI